MAIAFFYAVGTGLGGIIGRSCSGGSSNKVAVRWRSATTWVPAS